MSPTDEEQSDAPVEDAIDSIEDAANGDSVALGDLLDRFEDRPLGFILLVFGLLNALPVIGAIPFLPTVSAIVILATIFHHVAGGQAHFWAPDRLRRQEVSAKTVGSVLDRVHPIAAWVDRQLEDRAAVLVDGTLARSAICLVAGGLALAMMALSLVPGLAGVPALGIMVLGLALMGRDGLVALLGYLFAAASLGALVYLWQSVL